MCEAEINYSTNELTLYAVLFFYGNAATEKLSQQIAKDVSNHWNEVETFVKIKGKQYKVIFDIEGIWAKSLIAEMIIYNQNHRNNYFRIEEYATGHISFVDGVNSNTGYFKLDNLLDGSTTAAHEFGHTIGLDHPENMDIRGEGTPGIMYPRGTLVDQQFQWDTTVAAGAAGGTMNPINRKVLQQDIYNLHLGDFNYINGKAVIGNFSNIWHEAQQPS